MVGAGLYYWYPRAEAVTWRAHGPEEAEKPRRSQGRAGAQQTKGGMDNVPEKQPGMMACFLCQLRGVALDAPENWQHIISGCV